MSAELTFVAGLSCYRFVKLLPYSNGFVVRPRHDEIGEVADSECPNLTVVTFKLLDVLELNYLVLILGSASEFALVHALSPSQYLRSLSFPTVQK